MLTARSNTIMWGSPNLNGLDFIREYGATRVIRADRVNAMNMVQRGWDQPLRQVAAAILVDVFDEDATYLAPFFPNKDINTIIEQGRVLAQHTPLRPTAPKAA